MTNPFTSSRIQPGAQPFLFPGDETPESLLECSTGAGSCYLIVGEHGTGKSTLLQMLYQCFLQQLPADGKDLGRSLAVVPHMLWLRPAEKPNRTLLKSLPNWKAGDRVFIDGLEQLSPPVRWIVRWWVRFTKSICIATSHRLYSGYSLLWSTQMNSEVECQVIKAFLANSPAETVKRLMQSEAWRISRAKHQSNLRESLFDMYDWWQVDSSRQQG